jgi:hypothetical protein
MEKYEQNSPDFEEAQKFKSSEFYDNFLKVATRQHRNGSFFLSTFISNM